MTNQEPELSSDAPTVVAVPFSRGRLMRNLVIMGLCLAAGFGAGYAAFHPVDPPAAVVNGEVIPMSALHHDLEGRFGGEVLRDMISQRLIAQKADQEKIELRPENIDKRVKEIEQDPQAMALIKAGRLSEADLRRNQSTLLLLDALLLRDITPAQEKRYFEEHRNELQMLRLRHIQVATQEEADDLRSQIEKGADFAALAREHSLDPASKDAGGDLGPMRGNQIDPEVFRIVEKIEPGKTSPAVQTGLGYHLFQVTERKGDVASLRATIREAMAAPLRVDFVESLRRQAKIESNLPLSAHGKTSGESEHDE